MIDKRAAEKDKWRISERALVFFTMALGGIGALLGMRLTKHKAKNKKFRLAVVIGLIISLIPVIHIAHGLILSNIIRYVEIEFHSESWPVKLNGYRIAFMADFHTITDEDMKRVASELNERKLDLLLLRGAFLRGRLPPKSGCVAPGYKICCLRRLQRSA